MILDIESPRDFMQNLLDLINESSRIGYKVKLLVTSRISLCDPMEYSPPDLCP